LNIQINCSDPFCKYRERKDSAVNKNHVVQHLPDLKSGLGKRSIHRPYVVQYLLFLAPVSLLKVKNTIFTALIINRKR